MTRRRSSAGRAARGVEWVGGCPLSPFVVGEGRDAFRARIALWQEQPSGLIVAQEVLSPEEDGGAALARILTDALATPRAGTVRRPARIRVTDAACLAPVRAVAGGIPVEVAPTPELDEFMDLLADSMPEPGEPESDASASASVGRNDPCPCGSGRKYKKCHLRADEQAREPERARSSAHDLDNRISDEILSFALRRLGEAWQASAAVFQDVDNAVALALPWSLYEFRVRGRTAADRYLEERGWRLRTAERAWIEAQQRAWLSVWEVEQVEPGVGLTLRDLLTLEQRRVDEVLGSGTLVRRDAVLGRIVDAEGISLICGMHPRVLAPHDAAAVLDSVREKLRRKGVVPVERLRDEAIGRHLIERWEEVVARRERIAARAPALRNTSGDPFLLTVDHFALETGASREVASRLAALEGVKAPPPGESGPHVFLSPQTRRSKSGRTVLGVARLSERELRVETTSRERADALRRRIEDACQGLLRHRAREHADPLSEKAGPARGAEAAPPALPPEVHQALLAWKQRYYAEWLDERIPALGDATPRQAARTKKGRARLDLLLREMEHFEQRTGAAGAFDFATVRRDLGLA